MALKYIFFSFKHKSSQHILYKYVYTGYISGVQGILRSGEGGDDKVCPPPHSVQINAGWRQPDPDPTVKKKPDLFNRMPFSSLNSGNILVGNIQYSPCPIQILSVQISFKGRIIQSDTCWHLLNGNPGCSMSEPGPRVPSRIRIRCPRVLDLENFHDFVQIQIIFKSTRQANINAY